MTEDVEQATADPGENIAEQRAGPGIVVLSTSMQLLHMNRQAVDLSRKINECEKDSKDGKVASGVLPACLTELSGEIVKALHVRTEAKDWEQFEVKALAGDPDHPILLRGFGLPDRGGIEHSRIVVTMEEVGRQPKATTEQAKQRFQLTEREHSVIVHLIKGWTNKEIANALGITEQTVKEHIKHIMRKTNATTRTGILAQVLKT